jgi:hypothetical protein
MRLTLRTLLAYLDDILDATDAHELERKIEESEFASGLVHRIRSVTRKLRLGAPKLAGKGMGLDANTVAEYLDNTLPQDQVPDFEKICLESDVQLAEVAACHQILALVLGEPADVDPALRTRMRSLLKAAEHASPEALEEAARRGSAFLAGPPHPSPEHDYEDEQTVPAIAVAASAVPVRHDRVAQRLWPLVATLVAAFALALGVLLVLGPLDARHPVLGRFLPAAPTQVATAPGAGTASSSPAAAGSSAAADGAAAPARAATGSQTAGLAPPPTSPPSDPAVPAAAAAPAPSADDTAPVVPALPPVEAAPAMAAEAPGKTPADVTALTDPRLSRAKLPPAPDEAASAETPEPLATYTSDQHVLARLDAATGTWLRAVAHEPLAPDQRLVALPTYRPQILFSSGVQVVVIGPAELELLEADSDGVPGVKLHAGRLLAMSTGKPRLQLRLQFGARAAAASFDDLDSTLALEVRSYLPPGADPESQPASLVAELFSAAGRVSWTEQYAATPLALEPGQIATLVDAATAVLQPLDPLPDWLSTRNEPLIHQTASRALEPLLDPARPLLTALQDQVGNRQVEVRSLAVRSLLLFDEFEPFVTALNSRESRYYWKDLVESARAGMARSPASAAKLRAACERLRGEAAAELYRLLWGLSPEQLIDGGAEQLVTCLNSSSTDLRVLAYLNLFQITGKTNNYQPDLEPRMQRRSIATWERDLRQGQIRYKSPPVALPGTENTPREGSEKAATADSP